MNDDSLGKVTCVSSQSGRAITPQRRSTPQRSNSAPRSTSASKIRNQKLENATIDAQSCNRILPRSTSRRKQRKWENDNLVGLQAIRKGKYGREDSDEEDDDLNESMIQNMTKHIAKSESNFEKLSRNENRNKLLEYLQCVASLPQVNTVRTNTLRNCIYEWELAEFAWEKMEKRLRAVVSTVVPQRDTHHTHQFLSEFEDMVVRYQAGQLLLPQEGLFSSTVSALFSCPVEASPNGSLCVGLSSPFHRLLAHAVCQFHRLHSKSISIRRQRLMIISHFRSTGTASGEEAFSSPYHTLRLVPFTLQKLSSTGSSGGGDGSSSAEQHVVGREIPIAGNVVPSAPPSLTLSLSVSSTPSEESIVLVEATATTTTATTGGEAKEEKGDSSNEEEGLEEYELV